jgi:hypothetical protein
VVRLTLRFAGFCIIMLMTAWGIVRSQPHDDRDLHALLTAPDDCASPCFMHIRPSVTTMDDAFILLSRHSWVQQVQQSFNIALSRKTIRWRWSGVQPSVIDATAPGILYADYRGERVAAIAVQTRIPLFYAPLFEQPAFSLDAGSILEGNRLVVGGYYPDRAVWIYAPWQCPVEQFWASGMRLQWFQLHPDLYRLYASNPPRPARCRKGVRFR